MRLPFFQGGDVMGLWQSLSASVTPISQQSVDSQIAFYANTHNLPEWIPLMISQHEDPSRDPSIVVNDTNGAQSVGLFQINKKGLGAHYSIAQLQDPATNIRIAENAMIPAYKAGVQKGLTGSDLLDYVANNSGWPGKLGVSQTNQVEPQYDAALNQLYDKTQGQYPQAFDGSGPLTNDTNLTVAQGVAGSGAGSNLVTDSGQLNSAVLTGSGAVRVYTVVGGIILSMLLLYHIATN